MCEAGGGVEEAGEVGGLKGEVLERMLINGYLENKQQALIITTEKNFHPALMMPAFVSVSVSTRNADLLRQF